MAFVVWMLLGASVMYWGIQLVTHPLETPPQAVVAAESRGTRADLSKLLGVTAVAAVEAETIEPSRLRLLGVVAPRGERAAQAGEGVALIEVDGVPRTVRVGARVDGELRLLRVDARSAGLGLLGQAPSQTLQVAPPPLPATGSLPPAAPSPVVLGGAPSVYGQQLVLPAPGSDQPMPNRAEGLPLRR